MEPFEYRLKSFVNLGYDFELAKCLAESRDRHGVWIYDRDVKRLIEAIVKKGKSMEEARNIAFGIFSDV